MRIDSDISRINDISFQSELEKKVVGNDDRSSFERVFESALKLVNETNEYQKIANQAQIDYATGKTDNMLGVVMAQEKAYTSFNFTVQVTNKVIEAYREIMRLQV